MRHNGIDFIVKIIQFANLVTNFANKLLANLVTNLVMNCLCLRISLLYLGDII